MAERVTVEHNGERITLEVPDGTSDAEIQAYLQGSTPQTTSAPKPSMEPAAAVVQTALPAGVVPGPTGMAQLGKDAVQVARPMMTNVADVAKGVGTSYAKAPIKGVVDAAAAYMMFPPPFATAESVSSLYDKYKAAKQGVQMGQQILSASDRIPVLNAQGQPVVDAAGNPVTKPASRDAFRAMQDIGGPELKAKLSNLWGKNTGGAGNAAIQSWLKSEEAAQYLKNPAFREAADEFLGKVPSAMQQVGKVVGPLARGAGRVLGPAGLALNAYDAQQYAEASKLGERLAQGQGQQAPQAFRNMNVPYGQGFTNTMTPDQAQAVLESGNERDITAFGGRDKLSELIRLKAASKVLGPVAPQGM
jgi:hypothetical protein